MFAKARQLINELGLSNSCFYVIDRLCRRFSNGNCYLIRYLIVSQPISSKSLLPAKRGSKFIIREVVLGDPVISKFPVPEKVICERFAQNAKCFIAEKENDFVGYIWIVHQKYAEDEVRAIYFLPDGNSVWDFDVYITPQYRLGPAFLKLWDHVNAILIRKGVNCSFSRISAFNPGSKHAHERLGAKILYKANFLVLGRLQITVLGCAPYLHVSTKKNVSIAIPSE